MSVTTLNGSSVVVTGKITGYTRPEVELMLAQHGAHVQKKVTRATDVLIIGADVGATKINDAQKWGTQVIPWSDAEQLLRGGPAVTPVAAPAPPTAKNQPVPAQAGYRQILPMLAKNPGGKTPEENIARLRNGEWAFEIKWDGYRCFAHVNGKTILQSRGGKSYQRYAHIVEELDGLTVPCILDGELVVLDEDGNSDHARLHAGEIDAAKFVVFDVLEAKGVDLRSRPFRERRQVLGTILEVLDGEHVTASPLFDETEADALLEHARDNELEGIVAKRLNSPYIEKSRNGMWLKIKLRLEQEFVVVGYTKGEGNRAGTAGAFLLAVNDGTKTKPKWAYVGNVGTGGTIAEFEAIRSALKPNAANRPDIDVSLFTKAQLRETTFVKPEIVLQVKFQKWSPDGKLWHPSIQGGRDDKNPKEVTRSA